MEEIPCLCCGRFFLPRNRKQQYCTLVVCQKARKKNWHYNKLQNDSDYRANQRLSQQKWLKDNPDYYQNYRTNHPEKSERNRVLQRIRNKRRRQLLPPAPQLIAKMDASKASANELSGQYWLVPVIAKMDVAKMYIHAISGDCERLQRWTRGHKCI